MDQYPQRAARIAFAMILALYACYAAAMIYRTSFVVQGVRYYCLFDDAMISMRYARNLAEGYGPVWNPGGERVEGYSNPLWMGYMTLMHLLPVPAAKISLLVQVTGAACLVGNLFVVRKIGQAVSGNSPAAWLAAVVLTAFYLPLNHWGLQGMEVAPAVLLVSLAVWWALRCLAQGRFSPWLYAMLGAGLLVRMDLLVPAVVIWVFLTIADPAHRRRHFITGMAALGAGLALQTGLRVAYYGDPLPNTYYLKMTGYPVMLRMARGALVLWDFVRQMNPLVFLLPLATVFWRRDKCVTLLLAVFCGQLAYSVYVGGDAWEWWGGANRYVAVVMPLWFVLFACAADGIAAWFAKWRGAYWFFAVLLIAVGLLSTNALKGPRSLRCWALVDPPLHVPDHRQMLERALLLRNITRPEATVALAWAGIMPYFADRQTIDISGKNDRYIARLEAHGPSGENKRRHFHPGHLKWDYAYSIGRLQPDVVLQAGYPPGEAEPYLRDGYEEVRLDGFVFYLRKQSPSIRWERLRETITCRAAANG